MRIRFFCRPFLYFRMHIVRWHRFRFEKLWQIYPMGSWGLFLVSCRICQPLSPSWRVRLVFIGIILPAELWAWGRLSLSNRNEYQEYFLGGKGGRCVRLTFSPSCAGGLEMWGASVSCNPLGLSRPMQGMINFFLASTYVPVILLGKTFVSELQDITFQNTTVLLSVWNLKKN